MTPEELAGQADELLAIEQAAARDAAGAFRRRVEKITADLVKAWATFGEGTPEPGRLAALLARVLVDLKSALGMAAAPARLAVGNAVVEGFEHGLDVAELAYPAGFGDRRPAVEPDTGVADDVAGLVQGGRDRAEKLLVPEFAGSLGRALAAVGSGGERTAGELERLARTAANEAASVAVRASAEANGTGLLWVAERDGCVHCLALAGAYAPPGQPFDKNATYGDKPLDWPEGDLEGPPRHPNCRCAIRPWLPEFDPELPSALEREARRSIALGFRLPTESTPARLRAADRLLSGRPALPKTVVARARKAVKAGTFADRRR